MRKDSCFMWPPDSACKALIARLVTAKRDASCMCMHGLDNLRSPRCLVRSIVWHSVVLELPGSKAYVTDAVAGGGGVLVTVLQRASACEHGQQSRRLSPYRTGLVLHITASWFSKFTGQIYLAMSRANLKEAPSQIAVALFFSCSSGDS